MTNAKKPSILFFSVILALILSSLAFGQEEPREILNDYNPDIATGQSNPVPENGTTVKNGPGSKGTPNKYDGGRPNPTVQPTSSTAGPLSEPVEESPGLSAPTTLTDAEVLAQRASVGAAMRQPPSIINVHGRSFTIYGATAHDREIIEASLRRVPAAHIRSLPGSIVVADAIPHRDGLRHTGGGTRMASPPRAADRIHIASLSLNPDPSSPHWPDRYSPLTEDTPPLSRTLLHEFGHAIDYSGRNSRGGVVGLSRDTRQAFANVEWSGPAARQVQEQFAQAYMHYLLGNGLTTSQRTAMNTALTSNERRQTLTPHPSAVTGD
jgi:hypothetical protein